MWQVSCYQREIAEHIDEQRHGELAPAGWRHWAPSTSLTLRIMLACLRLTPVLLVSCPGMPDSFATPWIGNFQAGVLEWVAISFLQGIFKTQGSNPRLRPDSPALQADSLPLSH